MDEGCTDLLLAAGRGDADASGRLFARLYEELRRCAHHQLRGMATPQISTTVLVHETYLKLIHAERLDASSRGHFMALAARAMRQVLVDDARRIGAEKRGGQAVLVTLDEHLPDAAGEALEVLALDRALTTLEAIDARAARVVHLHFFAGLSFPAIAAIENLNERTIKRDWQAARSLLAAEMEGGSASDPPATGQPRAVR
ncbi:ECF-type sigma factor [Dokdonella koreensis]|uniref:ECF subfamily RNA polymerase sigma-24 subunit n=1 Tax=Dokdonella koreensis DS-123 TaxID=1300342 RepID=A0A161HIP7_9GAMM|nr:ECF-type sigma factor [Dokdonella koreensis]ANB16290.1 ECF subfamily RNA polymerase sigma-24 subunit [Dokdonella koreensis DS-123]